MLVMTRQKHLSDLGSYEMQLCINGNEDWDLLNAEGGHPLRHYRDIVPGRGEMCEMKEILK